MYKLSVILWYSKSENREEQVTFTILYLTFYLKYILFLIKLVALPFSKLDHRHLTYISHVRCLWMVQTKVHALHCLQFVLKLTVIWSELSILRDLIFDAAWLIAKVIALEIEQWKMRFCGNKTVSFNVYLIIGYIYMHIIKSDNIIRMKSPSTVRPPPYFGVFL